ncbi:hypothetical protein [aff. Roholtiella sp. LEGE 12411]|nr:hypothetical protein [aff. Roholtiella sp. LEGE 12411]
MVKANDIDRAAELVDLGRVLAQTLDITCIHKFVALLVEKI